MSYIGNIPFLEYLVIDECLQNILSAISLCIVELSGT